MIIKIALTGIIGVFIGLVILCLFLILIQKILDFPFKEKFKLKKNIPAENTQSSKIEKRKQEVSGEVIALIAATIYLDLRSFDEQKKLLTIQKVTKPYAPWVNSGKTIMISNNNLINSRKR